MNLSKSLYIRGIQCKKSLWLKKYRPELLTPPDAQAQAKFETGSQVGELALKLFSGGVMIPYSETTFNEKIELTKKYIAEGMSNIYEASFVYDGVFLMIDILHINDDGSMEIYEVKSSTEVKEVYLHDASIQYYVLNGLGFDVKRANIIHINNKYIREDELDVEKLFIVVDVTEEIKAMQNDISVYLKTFEQTLNDRDREPDVPIGPQCTNPYDCDAIEYCWRDVPDYSIFNISRLKTTKKFELYHNGIVHFHQLEDIYSFSLSQQIQITSELEQKETIDKDAIKEFLDTLTYPVYHLDFETFQQAIPEWKGVSPYMQIPFQYSIHIDYGDGRLEHREFLAQDGKDPRYELAKSLANDIPDNVTVLAYNAGFEKGVIQKLADQFSEFSLHLMSVYDNIKDLMIPFQKTHYYVPAMKGSYSIKYVLPAIVPEMQKAYEELSLVHHGGEAMQAFANLSKMDSETKEKYRKALLEYCKLDTLAMVKVLEKLQSI